jgi:type I restriction enzyme S subunit
MTAQTLLANFECLVDAPNAVPKLRGLILQLAVRGKLVPQVPDDEPASDLLRRILAERRHPIAGGKTREREHLESVAPDEVPFEVPGGWQWTRLGVIAEQRLGKMLDKRKNEGPLRFYLRNANVRWFGFDLSELLEMRIADDELGDVSAEKGDLVICEGGEPGRTAVWQRKEPIAIQKALHRVRPLGGISSAYLALMMREAADSGRLAERFTGATIRHLTGQALVPLAVPLPPLQEQKRIVAKVDELMTLCDGLEAKQQKKRAVRITLNRACLRAVTQPNGTSLATAWHRVRDHFDDLYCVPETVAELRQTILQLAVMGRLVPQGPGDEPASELLKRIVAEKRDLAPGSKHRGKQIASAADQADPACGLPHGWVCTSMEAVLLKMGSGSTPLGGKTAYTNEGVAFLRSQNVHNDGLRMATVARIPRQVHEQMAETHVLPKDVLLNITGASIARSAVVPDDFEEANVSQHVAILRPVLSEIRYFLHVWLISPVGYEAIMGAQVGVSREGLSMARLGRFIVPLPPLAEQQRIVAKVNELMARCDELEVRQQAARTSADNLLAAIVHRLTPRAGEGA